MYKSACVVVGGLLVLGCVACSGDGGSPTSPSALPAGEGTTISGTALVGDGAAAAAQRGGLSAPTFAGLAEVPAGLRVCVVGTDICIDVTESGSFQLTGDFSGDVELHFSGSGQDVRVIVDNVQPGELIVVAVSLNGDRGDLDIQSRHDGDASKVSLCHLEGNGDYHLIQVSSSAQDAHLAHGDGLPSGEVPSYPGLSFDGDCDIVGLEIEIQKATNDLDADERPGPEILAGSEVTWTYVVTNVGMVEVGNVVISDSVEGLVCEQPVLGVNETVTCSITGTAVAGQYSNRGVVTAEYEGLTVTDSDRSHYHNNDDAPDDDRAKVELCHLTGNGSFRLIEVSVSAEQAHLNHGDGYPGRELPDGSGFLDERCNLVTAEPE